MVACSLPVRPWQHRAATRNGDVGSPSLPRFGVHLHFLRPSHCGGVGSVNESAGVSCGCDAACGYRLRFNTPDPLSLLSRTVWLDPCTTMSIAPEIEYSLL